jgi:hypothetical protein
MVHLNSYGSSVNYGEIITNVGDYQVESNFKVEITHTDQLNDIKLKYSNKFGGGSLFITADNLVNDWFILIEDQFKLWVFDGNKTIKLAALHGDNHASLSRWNGIYELSFDWDTLPFIPPEKVLKKLPSNLRRVIGQKKWSIRKR